MYLDNTYTPQIRDATATLNVAGCVATEESCEASCEESCKAKT
jgi:hypothetical protein